MESHEIMYSDNGEFYLHPKYHSIAIARESYLRIWITQRKSHISTPLEENIATFNYLNMFVLKFGKWVKLHYSNTFGSSVLC